MNYRFFGRMTSPDGQEETWLASGERVVLAKPGTSLEDGYVIETVSADAVRLAYPALDAHVQIPLPPPPDPEHR